MHAAKQMEVASFGLIRARDRVIPALEGEVKLGVTEGLGTFWLAPRLVEFQRAHPTLLVDLSCAMRSADVLRLEADAAVQLTKPTNPGSETRQAWASAFDALRGQILYRELWNPEDLWRTGTSIASCCRLRIRR